MNTCVVNLNQFLNIIKSIRNDRLYPRGGVMSHEKGGGTNFSVTIYVGRGSLSYVVVLCAPVSGNGTTARETF